MTEYDADQIVQQALRHAPLPPAPHLTPRVLARIRALTPRPQFRLFWTDYALSLFATGMMGMALLMWQTLTPVAVARLQIQFWLIVQQMGGLGLAALLGGLVLVGLAVFSAALILAWPFQPRGV